NHNQAGENTDADNHIHKDANRGNAIHGSEIDPLFHRIDRILREPLLEGTDYRIGILRIVELQVDLAHAFSPRAIFQILNAGKHMAQLAAAHDTSYPPRIIQNRGFASGVKIRMLLGGIAGIDKNVSGLLKSVRIVAFHEGEPAAHALELRIVDTRDTVPEFAGKRLDHTHCLRDM